MPHHAPAPQQRASSALPPLPARPADGHKGTFGRVLIVGGSPGMSGAVCLAGVAALRGGAGLVTVAAPAGIASVVAGYEPSYLTLSLPQNDDGSLAAAALLLLYERLESMQAAAIGPGWGQSDAARRIALNLYQKAKCPLVVDADALNALAAQPDALGRHVGPRVLTPHPGEFARLIGSDVKTVQSDREQLSRRFAADYGAIVVLKGQGTVITDGNRTFINPTGNSGLATGGTGDVLTGLTAALLAQQMPPLDAARTAVYLHGLAGDLAADELSQPGLIASDLPRFLGRAWKQLIEQSCRDG